MHDLLERIGCEEMIEEDSMYVGAWSENSIFYLVDDAEIKNREIKIEKEKKEEKKWVGMRKNMMPSK